MFRIFVKSISTFFREKNRISNFICEFFPQFQVLNFFDLIQYYFSFFKLTHYVMLDYAICMYFSSQVFPLCFFHYYYREGKSFEKQSLIDAAKSLDLPLPAFKNYGITRNLMEN